MDYIRDVQQATTGPWAISGPPTTMLLWPSEPCPETTVVFAIANEDHIQDFISL